ncbi:MAG: hypothetical protein ACEY27_00110 [Candidatus Hodgkinia cicadicola]
MVLTAEAQRLVETTHHAMIAPMVNIASQQNVMRINVSAIDLQVAAETYKKAPKAPKAHSNGFRTTWRTLLTKDTCRNMIDFNR